MEFLKRTNRRGLAFILLLVILIIASYFILFTNHATQWPTLVQDLESFESANSFSKDHLKITSIHNSSLGFQNIRAIVMPHRDDQLDILGLLQYTNDIKIEIHPGVYPDDIRVLPQAVEHSQDEVRNNPLWKAVPSGTTACWRAHANVWRDMLVQNWRTTLLLEGDADWPIDIRDELETLADAIPALMTQLNGADIADTIARDDNDPYMSDSWDLLQLGHCAEFPRTITNGTIVYTSPSTMPAHLMRPSDLTKMVYNAEHIDIEDLTVRKQKLLRVSLGSMCTAGYAISRRGAAKLLHKTTRMYDGPVDVAIKDMSESLELVVLSVVPPIFSQRKYIAGSGPNSDMDFDRQKRQQAGVRDFEATLDANTGFDGEDKLWAPPEERLGRSASMAMSGIIWPEKTSLGPESQQSWLTNALKEIDEYRITQHHQKQTGEDFERT